MVYPLVSFSNNWYVVQHIICTFGSEVSPCVHTQLYEVTFLSSNLFWITLVFSCSLELPFWSYSQKAKALFTLLYHTFPVSVISSRPEQGDDRESNSSLHHPASSDHRSSNWKLPSISFSCLQAALPPLLSSPFSLQISLPEAWDERE